MLDASMGGKVYKAANEANFSPIKPNGDGIIDAQKCAVFCHKHNTSSLVSVQRAQQIPMTSQCYCYNDCVFPDAMYDNKTGNVVISNIYIYIYKIVCILNWEVVVVVVMMEGEGYVNLISKSLNISYGDIIILLSRKCRSKYENVKDFNVINVTNVINLKEICPIYELLCVVSTSILQALSRRPCS